MEIKKMDEGERTKCRWGIIFLVPSNSAILTSEAQSAGWLGQPQHSYMWVSAAGFQMELCCRFKMKKRGVRYELPASRSFQKSLPLQAFRASDTRLIDFSCVLSTHSASR
jgi:hypothetical protein